jgi:hypothetical protein
MSYHPDVAHLVTGSRRLLMGVHGSYAQTALIFDLITVVAVEAYAEALRLFEFIVVNLGLRMIMRRITRPAAGLVENLA